MDIVKGNAYSDSLLAFGAFYFFYHQKINITVRNSSPSRMRPKRTIFMGLNCSIILRVISRMAVSIIATFVVIIA